MLPNLIKTHDPKSPEDLGSSDSKSLLTRLRSRVENHQSKNQQLSSEQSSYFLKSEHLNDLSQHRMRRFEYQKSSIGQLGLGSLKKTNDHEQDLILD